MHSADRTLLTQLGFKDPDKRDPRHDLACRYLTRPNAAMKMFELFPDAAKGAFGWGVESTKLEYHLAKGDGKYKTTIGFMDGVITYRGFFHEEIWMSIYGSGDADEREIFGDYLKLFQKSTAEIKLSPSNSANPTGVKIWNVEATWPCTGLTNGSSYNSEGKNASGEFAAFLSANKEKVIEYAKKHPSKKDQKLAFEVKIAPSPIGDILRQIELYKEYFAFRPLPLWVLAVAFPLTDGDKRSIEHEGIRVVRLGAKFDEFVAAQDQRPAELEEI